MFVTKSGFKARVKVDKVVLRSGLADFEPCDESSIELVGTVNECLDAQFDSSRPHPTINQDETYVRVWIDASDPPRIRGFWRDSGGAPCIGNMRVWVHDTSKFPKLRAELHLGLSSKTISSLLALQHRTLILEPTFLLKPDESGKWSQGNLTDDGLLTLIERVEITPDNVDDA